MTGGNRVLIVHPWVGSIFQIVLNQQGGVSSRYTILSKHVERLKPSFRKHSHKSCWNNIQSIMEVLAGHASGCWLSALGAGVPYNREKNESKLNFLAVAHFWF